MHEFPDSSEPQRFYGFKTGVVDQWKEDLFSNRGTSPGSKTQIRPIKTIPLFSNHSASTGSKTERVRDKPQRGFSNHSASTGSKTSAVETAV